MRFAYMLILWLTATSNSFAQFTNVMISGYHTPGEPCISMSLKDTSQLAGGANINNYFYSSDAGKTWSSGLLSSPWGVWGDPVIISDTSGFFYYFHLSEKVGGDGWIDRIVCQKSTDGGKTWSDGTYVGLNGKKNQDKE
ncbi:MAG: sialidase family protein, partial [Bacteroidia bacterium]|nr:sialidase family protein [Bacteroidia bacterium]